MVEQRYPLDVYERTYGPLPAWFRIAGCTVVRRVDTLTNEAHLSIELPEDIPTVQSRSN